MDNKIPDFAKARVLVVGDIMLDRYWYGDAKRISPEAPVPVMRVGSVEERPGGAGNVALNLAALGAEVTLIGLTGQDSEADILENFLKEKNISCRLTRVSDRPTITKLRVISQHQQLIRLDFEEAFQDGHVEPILSETEKALQNVDAVILSDYGKGTLKNTQAFIKLAKKAHVPVFIDPKNMDFSVYNGATILTPNFKEFVAVVGPCADENEITTKALHLIKEFSLGSLLVTRGENGMSLFEKGKEPLHFPTDAQEVFDVTGAGDTVIATLAASLSAGCDLSCAVKLANIAAGISVSKLGAATVTVPELRRKTNGYHQGGILTEDSLAIAISDAKAHGEKVVMTNGCFDILHAGHVHYLEQAKTLGDRLIVAINDDASVKRLKGAERPINPLAHRMEVIAGLASVDWVVSFSEDTPERLVCRLLPDSLVKGGDWKPEQIAGSKCVLENGGEVHSLDFVEGHSTTSMIDSITKGSEK